MDERDAIMMLLGQRGPERSICPSEAARLVLGEDGWREAMEPVREAGRALAAEGLILVTQKGSAVDPATARGPIRYRLRETND
ncbi:MAG: DUF3253 domain-containing protein [Pseudomonadota bacterium]